MLSRFKRQKETILVDLNFERDLGSLNVVKSFSIS